MKGILVPSIAAFSIFWLSAFGIPNTASAQSDVVLNEINHVVGPEYGQFVE